MFSTNHVLSFAHFIKKSLGFLCLFFYGLSSIQGQQKVTDSLGIALKKIEQTQQENASRDTTYIGILNRYAFGLLYYKNDSLRILSEKALQYSLEIQYSLGEANSRLNLGNYYYEIGDYKKAEVYLEKALVISKELKDSNLILEIINSLSLNYNMLGDYKKSSTLNLAGIKLAKERNNILMGSILNENIANLYSNQKEYKTALEFYEKVEILNAKLENPIYSAESMSNIAAIYCNLKKGETALDYIDKSIAIFEKHRVEDWLVYAYAVKGDIYLMKKNYKWAIFWYKQSALLSEKVPDDDKTKVDLLVGKGKAYFGMEKWKLAKKNTLDAFNLSGEINYKNGHKNAAQTLYKINKQRGAYKEALKYHELAQRISDTLFKVENKKSLAILSAKIAYEGQEEILVLKNKQQLAKKQNYIYVGLVFLCILFVVIIYMILVEVKRKKLNQKLKERTITLQNRELELKESNKTKDKLFSIIGHDLRGPIDALEGLLELCKNREINKKEFLKFIPKMRTDVGHISFTLNNMLSWGQNQMKGMVTKPIVLDLKTVAKTNIELYDEIALNKSITIVNNLNDDILVWSDRDQLAVILRNLVSNALKFTPVNGQITIDAIEKYDFWQICISDTGIGMSEEVVSKLFLKNNTRTTYGTNNEKGTGLGLSLCKEMVEKNKGNIWVESKLQKGSYFYFTIPKADTAQKKIA